MEQREDWYAGAVETDRKLVADEGKGKPIVLRKFDFALPPGSEPTEAELVRVHKSKIQAFLWRDDLVLVQEPKVTFNKDNKGFTIWAACQARAGAVVLDSPELLQRIK